MLTSIDIVVPRKTKNQFLIWKTLLTICWKYQNHLLLTASWKLMGVWYGKHLELAQYVTAHFWHHHITVIVTYHLPSRENPCTVPRILSVYEYVPVVVSVCCLIRLEDIFIWIKHDIMTCVAYCTKHMWSLGDFDNCFYLWDLSLWTVYLSDYIILSLSSC